MHRQHATLRSIAHAILAGSALLSLSLPASAQGIAPAPPQSTEAAPQAEPPALSGLAATASSHTEFTLDRSMLALAGALSGTDEPTRQAIGRLQSIAVHSYRFQVPGLYNSASLDALRAQYSALGWRHLVTANSHAASPAPLRTDLWVRLQGVNVQGAAVLLAGPSSVNLIVVNGSISTVDLLHLRGHFGIPRFPDDALPPIN